MESNMMVLPGDSIFLATQFAFSNNGVKLREDERAWDYKNTVEIIHKLKRRTIGDLALLGLELWWARIHIKKDWGKFLERVDISPSAASRFKAW